MEPRPLYHLRRRSSSVPIPQVTPNEALIPPVSRELGTPLDLTFGGQTESNHSNWTNGAGRSSKRSKIASGSQSPNLQRMNRRSSLESEGMKFFGCNASFETRASGFGLPERMSSHLDGSGTGGMEFESTSTFLTGVSSRIEPTALISPTVFNPIPTFSTAPRGEPLSLRPSSQNDMELDCPIPTLPPMRNFSSSTPASPQDTSLTRKEAFESLRLSHLAEGEGFINGLRHWENDRSRTRDTAYQPPSEADPHTLNHDEISNHEDLKDEEEIIVSIHMQNEASVEAGVQEVSDKLSTGWGIENHSHN